MEIDIGGGRSTRKKQIEGRGIFNINRPLNLAYNSPLLISVAKKKDLMSLLKDGVIPSDYADYFMNIPSTSSDKYSEY